jgi:hypothetical protein
MGKSTDLHSSAINRSPRPVVGAVVQYQGSIDYTSPLFTAGDFVTVVEDVVPDWHDALIVQRADGVRDMVWPEELNTITVAF